MILFVLLSVIYCREIFTSIFLLDHECNGKTSRFFSESNGGLNECIKEETTEYYGKITDCEDTITYVRFNDSECSFMIDNKTDSINCDTVAPFAPIDIKIECHFEPVKEEVEFKTFSDENCTKQTGIIYQRTNICAVLGEDLSPFMGKCEKDGKVFSKYSFSDTQCTKAKKVQERFEVGSCILMPNSTKNSLNLGETSKYMMMTTDCEM